MYTKGDIIKLTKGEIAIVLNDGIKGREFVEQYNGLYIFDVFFEYEILVRLDYKWTWGDTNPKVETVWYQVLIGDVKGWADYESLEHHVV